MRAIRNGDVGESTELDVGELEVTSVIGEPFLGVINVTATARGVDGTADAGEEEEAEVDNAGADVEDSDTAGTGEEEAGKTVPGGTDAGGEEEEEEAETAGAGEEEEEETVSFDTCTDCDNEVEIAGTGEEKAETAGSEEEEAADAGGESAGSAEKRPFLLTCLAPADTPCCCSMYLCTNSHWVATGNFL